MRVHSIMTRALIACAFTFSMGHADTGGRLFGRVTDETGVPLAGALIRVTGNGAVGRYETRSAEDGTYAIPGLPLREPLIVNARAINKISMTYSGLVVRKGFGIRRDFRLRSPGLWEVVVVFSPHVGYHISALQGIRSALEADLRLLPLTGLPGRNGRRLRRALEGLPNAVIAIGGDAGHLARREIKYTPVVYTMVPDPWSDDLLVANLCGSPLNGGFGNQLDRLAALKPEARRLGTVYDPHHLAHSVRHLRRAAAAHGMALEARTASNPAGVAAALRALDATGIDAFYLLMDPELIDAAALARIGEFVTRRSIIYIVPDSELLDSGGTFVDGPGFREMGAHAGRMVEAILSGAVFSPDNSVVFPTVRRFTLNSVEAERLGLVTVAAGDK